MHVHVPKRYLRPAGSRGGRGGLQGRYGAAAFPHDARHVTGYGLSYGGPDARTAEYGIGGPDVITGPGLEGVGKDEAATRAVESELAGGGWQDELPVLRFCTRLLYIPHTGLDSFQVPRTLVLSGRVERGRRL